MIQDVLSQRDEHPHSCYCPICCGQHLIDGEGDWWDDKGSSFRAQTFCAPAPQTGVWEALNQYFSMTVPALVRTKNPSASSSNSAQSRATIQSTTSSSTAFSTTGQSTQSASASSSNSGSTQTTSSNCSNQSLYIPPSPVRVLFGVQGRRWSLELEKIILAGLSNDPTFFRELKARYKKHRSSIKLLLSPYRFRFCRFVKVSFLVHHSFSADQKLTYCSSKSSTPDESSPKATIFPTITGMSTITNTLPAQAKFPSSTQKSSPYASTPATLNPVLCLF